MTVSQYFVYKRPIAWTLLFATLAGGFAACRSMPQRQDPVIQIRLGLVSTEYPGASPIEVEQEVSRKIEKKLAENPAVEHVRSTSRQGLSTVFADLYESTRNAEAVWQDLDNKLAAMTDLPVANGVPLKPKLDKDFGDTVAVMLTLSSPPVSDLEVECRAEVVAEKIREARAARPESLRGPRYSGVLVHPSTVDSGMLERLGRACLEHLEGLGLVEDGQTIPLLGAMVLDFRLADGRDPAAMRDEIRRWESDNVANGLGHPDIWPGVIVGDPSELLGELKARCQAEPGGVARYSYEELHRFADMIQDRLRQSTKVGKIEQLGVVGERVYLYYSNRRLSASGSDLPHLVRRLQERNHNAAGGTVELPRQNLAVKPSGKLRGDGDIGDVVVDLHDGSPLYLRDLFEVVRGYDDPPKFLNFRTLKFDRDHPPTEIHTVSAASSPRGEGEEPKPHAGATQLWTSRAITLAIRQVKGTQIADFGRELDEGLASLKDVLPDDLRIERTSDEPERVRSKIGLFIDNLVEAIVIVVLISLLFMEWRSAVLIALSIPITLGMTFIFCAALGVDLQQISIAALIIALGLLVDDPVVAGDAINRELADGTPRDVAAWLGPQKLSRAILYATITNCAAFLPLLVCSGLVGEYIWSLPVVVTSSLVASRLVSMTFIPLLGYYVLKGQPGMEAGLKEGGRSSRFARIYNGFSEVCMEHKWASLAVCLIGLGAGCSLLPLLGTNLFPKDLHSAFTVNLYLPEGSSIRESKAEAMAAVAAIDEIAGADIEAYTTFVGAGGPRFWLSIVPEQPASNYAQVLVHTRDKHQTYRISERVKNALPPRLTVARAHVQALESGPPIGVPVQFRVLGQDPATVRRLGDQIKGFMREFPGTDNIQDDWDPEFVQIGLWVDPDRANVSGVSHQDVALFVGGALSGFDATTIRQHDRLIPVTLKLRPDERSRMDDLRTMSVVTSQTGARVPLDQISSFAPEFIPPKIGRRDNERCMIIKCDIAPGMLTSVVYDHVEARLATATKDWPAGYHFQIGGEKEEQGKGFRSLAIAMVVSILSIYLALILQFNSLAKPLVVFAAVPFGMIGGLMGLIVFGVPLGFFALLGVSSLVGVIISHVIVLFEYIEEAHERGEPLRRAVIDAALVRLRPVLVTVLATVGGLIPLALKGGPLWEPLCYVQIMGLLIATLVTKVVVPVLYVLFVENFKLIRWDAPGERSLDRPPAEHALASPTGHHHGPAPGVASPHIGHHHGPAPRVASPGLSEQNGADK